MPPPSARVLVVDDDETTAETLVLVLRQGGFDAEFVLTGADALAYALTTPLDAVILDLHLALDDIPGFLVLTSMRAKHRSLPIIAATGWYLRDEHEAEARGLGVTEYLLKPLDPAQLMSALRAALHSTAESRTEAATAAEIGSGSGSNGEVAAVENAFIVRHLPRLVRTIRRSFPGLWYDAIAEQAEDTLLEFLVKLKGGIWPVRRCLRSHLEKAAWRNARDHAQSAARRRANEARYASEQAQVTHPYETESIPDVDAELALAYSDAERRALRRWLADEGALQIGQALGISHLSPMEQVKEVKRFKDRIKKRARRTITGDG